MDEPPVACHEKMAISRSRSRNAKFGSVLGRPRAAEYDVSGRRISARKTSFLHRQPHKNIRNQSGSVASCVTF
jgi:hypothetical protein